MDKKIIIIITEGQTDKTALSLGLNSLFRDQRIQFEFVVTGGDITSDYHSSPKNVLGKISFKVKKYMDLYSLCPEDLLLVAQITDADGAFISEEAVEENEDYSKTHYDSDRIITAKPVQIIKRNERKKANISKLVQEQHITIGRVKIPYRIFYMSANLDHVLCNNANLSKEEKIQTARAFQEQYGNFPEKFKEFFFSFLSTVSEDYLSSWDYIQTGRHSLERISNLGILISHVKRSLNGLQQ